MYLYIYCIRKIDGILKEFIKEVELNYLYKQKVIMNSG